MLCLSMSYEMQKMWPDQSLPLPVRLPSAYFRFIIKTLLTVSFFLKPLIIIFFQFILCCHLLLGLILSDCDPQCFKSHKNSLLRKYAHNSVTHPQGTNIIWEAIGHHTWFPAASQEKMGFLQGLHRVCQPIRVFWTTQASQTAPDTHVWAIEWNCLSVPSPLSIWTKAAQECLGCAQWRRF